MSFHDKLTFSLLLYFQNRREVFFFRELTILFPVHHTLYLFDVSFTLSEFKYDDMTSTCDMLYNYN